MALPTNFSDASVMFGTHAAAHNATNRVINNLKITNILDNGAVGDGVTDDGNAINAAITAAGVNGIVLFPSNTYYSTKRHVPLNGQTWIGGGIDNTRILGNRGSDYSVYYLGSSSSVLTNFQMQDMTIDANNVANASCMSLSYASNCILRRVKFVNGAVGGWLFKFAVSNGATETFLNDSNKLIDCVFDTHAGSLEMLLLMNCSNTTIVRPKFLNKTVTSGPVLGLWQKCFETRIIDPIFQNLSSGTGAIYINLSCQNIWITRPHFENVSNCISQSISDNGAFGYTAIDGVFIERPVIIGGARSTTGVGIAMKSCTNWEIDTPYIQNMQTAIIISTLTGGVLSSNWKITNPQIKNNNASNDFSILHPGIAISTTTAGALHGLIEGGSIYDDQGTPTQAYPISIGGASFTDLTIRDTYLAPTGSGTPIGLHDSGALGANVKIDNVNGLNPDAVYSMGSVSGSQTFARSNGSIIKAILSGNTTATLPNPFLSGITNTTDELRLELTQDATGSRAMTWPSNFKKTGGSLVLSTTAGATDIITMRWDGTNWVEVSRALNVS